MRVALLSDWYLPRRGGIELHLADLAARLAAAGHAVDLLTSLPADGPDDDAPPPGVRVVRLGVPRLPGAGIACTPAVARAVDAAVAAGGYDVVHSHASVVAPVAWAAVRAARRRDVPCVLTVHSMLRAGAHLLGLADRAGGWARGAVLVTGVSTVVRDALHAAIPRARVGVLANGTDVAWWRCAASAPDDARPADGLRLVSAMRLARKKRALAIPPLLAAARAAARAAGAGDVRWVVAGDGPERARLARAAAPAGDALVLAGWQPRAALRHLYRDAHAFVLPTVHESFGIAALEARAAGLPVVAHAGTGVADFVRDGVDGVLCADDAAMAAAGARLARDAGWRGALAAASAEAPPCAFDWPAIVAHHEAAYAEAARG